MDPEPRSSSPAASCLRAVIWDFDGTLVDSRHRNLAVTRTILEHITGRPADAIVPLRSLELYDAATRRSPNWRELYVRELGLSLGDTERAGQMWVQAQFDDPTPAVFFAGIHDVLADLDQIPHAVVSQNSAPTIAKALDSGGVRDSFEVIVGHESVARDKLKPHPEAMLLCLELLALLGEAESYGRVLFVGDHEVDTTCALRTNEWLEQHQSTLRVESVGAIYGGGRDHDSWKAKPMHTAHSPADILRVARGIGFPTSASFS